MKRKDWQNLLDSLWNAIIVEFCGYQNGIWYMTSFVLTVWLLQINFSVIYFTPLYNSNNNSIYFILMLQKLN